MQVADSLSSAATSAGAALGEMTETLTSTDFWLGAAWTALTVVFILALAFLVLAVIKRIKRRWVASVQDRPTLDKKRQRVLTVADLLGSLSRYAVWTITAVMVLDAIGLPVAPLLAGAGIAGLAIGFGAQTFVKDVISGFFLLFDDTIGIGDLITFNGETATVEYVGLRLIKARKFDGELLMIPAGDVRTFGNKSIGFARVIVPVELSYEGRVEEGLAAMEAVAAEWATSEHAQAVMLEEAPQVQALTSLGESGIQARIVVQVRPGEQFEAERDLRRLLKDRFDEHGVEIPFPRRTVYVKREGDAPGDAADGGLSDGGSSDDEAAAAGADD